MPEAPDPMSAVVKQSFDLVKDALGLAHGEVKAAADKATGDKAPEARGGPLQLVGRLYIGLTTIAALTASASAYFDTKGKDAISCETQALRFVVAASVISGLVGGLWLLWYLVRKHPMYLSSPTELTSTVHQHMLDRGEPEGKEKKHRDEGKSHSDPKVPKSDLKKTEP